MPSSISALHQNYIALMGDRGPSMSDFEKYFRELANETLDRHGQAK
jgi:hypothetical protein